MPRKIAAGNGVGHGRSRRINDGPVRPENQGHSRGTPVNLPRHWARLYLRGVPLLPESPARPRENLDSDPFRYLRGVSPFSWAAARWSRWCWRSPAWSPGPCCSPAVLWTLFGLHVRYGRCRPRPFIELMKTGAHQCGTGPADGGFSAEETLAARGPSRCRGRSVSAARREPRTTGSPPCSGAPSCSRFAGRTPEAVHASSRRCSVTPTGSGRLKTCASDVALAELYEQGLARSRPCNGGSATAHRPLSRRPPGA